MIRSYGTSHVGQVRTNNEDSYAEHPELGLYVVADGMGGAQAGERASKLTVDTVVEETRAAGPAADLDSLIAAVGAANQKVRAEAGEARELRGMGTTVVAVLVRNSTAYLVNVGDSRIYRRRGDELELITTDHSWVNDIGRGLGLTDDQLKTHPYRNVLTKAIGAEDDVEVQSLEIEFAPGDILMLCSDGLHGVADNDDLQEILTADQSIEEKGERLLELVLDRGAPDNVTLVMVENTGNHGGTQ